MGWEKWLKDYAEKMVLPDKVFREANSPIVVNNYHAGKLIINPCLKDYDFAQMVDPYTAFQEIDMFLGNNMVDQVDPRVNRTNEEIRDSKGMDKWSFRTPSPGNKSRKQRKK